MSTGYFIGIHNMPNSFTESRLPVEGDTVSPTLTIAAVFATMDHAQISLACVRALAEQTRPPDMVLVADNVSSDDTVATLESLAELPFKLIVHRMQENGGNVLLPYSVAKLSLRVPPSCNAVQWISMSSRTSIWA